MKNKIFSLEEAVSEIKDGSTIALGGNVLHRSPSAFCGELIRQGKKNLTLVKTAGAFDIDVLCAAGAVKEVMAGYVGYESEFGLANFYRKAVENGEVKCSEHACYTIISALRAASYGVPFMPVRGLQYGELIEKNSYFKVMDDPFTGEKITAVKAIEVDYAIIHVQEADVYGNGRIIGPNYEDELLAKSAKKVMVTAERIVNSEILKNSPKETVIPDFLVQSIIHVPKGAYPCSCAGYYDIDSSALNKFREIKSKDELTNFIERYLKKGARR